MVVALGIVLALAAQDDCCKEQCGMQGILCPKEGKCEGKCREICDKAAETLKAVRARVVELMKKECGGECPCTAGKCEADGCGSCDTVKTKVFAPILKERVTARFKEFGKKVSHTVAENGKSKEVECTFLTGATCSVCVNDMADASWKKMKELFSKKK